MEKNIRLYLISGFLGSGKTTFLRGLLTQMDGLRIGVIVNEFGSVGVDGTLLRNSEDMKMVEINNGSIFCACLKGGFVKTLVAFLEQPVDYLFVEASGLADPGDMQKFLEQTKPYLERKPHITRAYDYRGCICVVDAIHFLDFSRVFVPAENQIRKSRFIVLNKAQDAGEARVEETRRRLDELNPEAFVYATNYGKLPLALLEEKLETEDGGRESSNAPWNRPASYVLRLSQAESIGDVERFCARIAAHTIRVKGFFCAAEGGFGQADCVGGELSVHAAEKIPADAIRNRLVIIGRSREGLRETLERAWTACCKQPMTLQEE